MPKITLFFPKDFEDPAWAGSSFCLEAPDDHGHHRGGEWVLGRHPAADVTLSVRSISKHHCAVNYSYAANRWAIQDLGSTNGTRLNGELLFPNDPRPLKVGDHLHIGPNLVQVVEDEEDTVNDDGPSTIVGTAPLDHKTGAEVAAAVPSAPRTFADVAYLGASWIFEPSTLSGKIYRLVVLGVGGALLIILLGSSTAGSHPL